MQPFFLKVKPTLLVKIISLYDADFAMAVLVLISHARLIIYQGNQTVEIFNILQLFLIHHDL
jgi:hypothetical protein